MRLFFVFFALTFISIPSFSQSGSVKITGKITDKSTGQPLEFATIALIKSGTTEIVTGSITNFDGEYAIDVPAGTYDIRYEYISYETQTLNNQSITEDKQMPNIILDIDSESLDEVIVRAETTDVQIRLDKKIYNIGKDLAARGANVGDVLSNIPSVDVDVEGAVSLRGNENVTILINGKPSAIAGFGDTDALTQLPADAIDRIEVITSPSARYDASGTAGILNIILKKDSVLGFNGSLSTNFAYQVNNSVNTNLNYRASKFNIFNTIGVSYMDIERESFTDNTFESGDYSRTYETNTSRRIGKRFNTNLGIEYFLTEKSSLTASGYLRLFDRDEKSVSNNNKYIDNSLSEISLREENEDEDDIMYQFSLNYVNDFNDKGHKLTADLQYSFHNEVEDSFIEENNTLGPIVNYPSEDITNEENEKEFLFQVDYVLPIGENAQFEAGYRGNFENNITDYILFEEDTDTGILEYNELLSNTFDYTENIQALYAQYGNKFGKFSFLLGLRAENSRLIGEIDSDLTQEQLEQIYGVAINTNFDKDYWGLFPTANFVYELSESENVSLGYNRRINRPRGWDINPFPSRSSLYNIFQGNPDLDPAYASAFDVGYLKRWDKLTLSSSVYYQHETDAFERVRLRTGEVVNGIEVIRTLPINLSTNQRIGAEASFMYNPARWLRLNGSFNFFRFETDGEFDGIEYGTENTSWFARFSSRVTLPYKIDWQTNVFYRGPSENSQTKTEDIFVVDLAFGKDIMNDNASIGFNISDLLNSRKWVSNTIGDGFTSYSERQWRPRQFLLSFTYRFNQQKQNQRDRQQQSNGGGDFEGGEF